MGAGPCLLFVLGDITWPPLRRGLSSPLGLETFEIPCILKLILEPNLSFDTIFFFKRVYCLRELEESCLLNDLSPDSPEILN